MPPSTVVEEFACMLQRCLPLRRHQILLYTHIRRCGLEAHWMLGNRAVFKLAESECMAADVQHIFGGLSNPSKSWNTLITGYVKHGRPSHAVKLYVKMHMHKVSHYLDGYSLLALLKACIEQKDLDIGGQIHQHIVEHGLLQTDAFLGSTLVNMYAKCGSMAKAWDTFNTLSLRDVVSWTALLNGYVEHGQWEEAFACLEKMQLERVSPDAFTFSGSLKACSSAGAIDKGQEFHTGLTMVGIEDNVVLSSALVDMYAKNDFVEEALNVLKTAANCNIVTWNALLSGLTEHGYNEKVLECFQQLQNESKSTDSVTSTCVLQACGKMGLITFGEEMHSLIVIKGEDGDPALANTLVDMYAKGGFLEEAHAVFCSLPLQSVVTWNALIGGYVEHQQGDEALACCRRMHNSNVSPDYITFLHILKACGDEETECEVQELHTAVLKKGLEKSLFVANTLIDVYVKKGMLEEARNLFDRLETKDRVSWTVLILGYAEHAHSEAALFLITRMQSENVPLEATAYSCCLKFCAGLGDANMGQLLHAEILRKGLDQDLFLANSLLDMYVRCGLFVEACEIIDKLQVRSTSSWNTIIKGFMDCQLFEESLNCFELMQYEAIDPDSVTYTCCLHACSDLGLVDKGQELHSAIIKKGLDENVIVGSTLVEAYCKWGLLVEAQQVFSRVSVKSQFSWTALITGYLDFGCPDEVLQCWKQIQCEGAVFLDVVLYICCLRACAILNTLDKGMDLHMEMVKKGLEQDCNVGCTLVLMYGKCNSLLEAQGVFDKLDLRTEVTWAVLLAAYLEHGNGHVVLDCLEQMQALGFSASDATLVSGLKACGSTENMGKGQELCNQIMKRGIETDSIISIAIVDMYAKCGSLLEAQRTFDKLSGPRSSLGSVLITGYADAGESDTVFNVFDMMSRESPCLESVPFISVLKACAHAGLVDHGEKYMECMFRHHNIQTNLEHCSCIIDLLARAGGLEEALMLINVMPFHPTIVVWQTLLGACRMCRNVKLGTFLFEQVLELDVRDCAAYVCMSNIYAESSFYQYSQHE